jgi:hypothetical protein
MRKLVVLAVVALLSVPMALAPAGAKEGAKIARRHPTKPAPEQVTYQSAKGKRALSVARAAGATGATVGSAAASAQGDFDNDGRLDLAIGAPEESFFATGDGSVNVIYGSATGLVSAGNQLLGEGDFTVAFNNEAFGAALAAGDFNGDGFEDLAVGIPEWDSGGGADAGAVAVYQGSPTGLTATGLQLILQGNGGVNDASEAGDHFGAALAAANFGNGAAVDLAVGVPSEDLIGTDEGAVHVFYGSVAKLDLINDAFFNQNTSLVEDIVETGDNFGSSLAAGNFGQTGQADLAIGVPLEDVGVAIDAGAVNVLYGSAASGVTNLNDQLWHQDSEGIKDVAEEADSFGVSLAAANLGKSSQADLAIGAYLEGITGQADLAGAVNVIYGGTNGLVAAGNQFWSQNTPAIAEASEIIDFFGWSLAAGNFGKTAQADLAIGVPLESLGATSVNGVVHVLYGTSTGLKTAGAQFWSQNSPGVLGANANGDEFGWSLAAANLGKSAQADLSIGAPGDVVSGVAGGAVNVLYGTATGLSAPGDQLWHQDSPGINGVAEAGDRFGQALG